MSTKAAGDTATSLFILHGLGTNVKYLLPKLKTENFPDGIERAFHADPVSWVSKAPSFVPQRYTCPRMARVRASQIRTLPCISRSDSAVTS
jgi:predicted esterase